MCDIYSRSQSLRSQVLSRPWDRVSGKSKMGAKEGLIIQRMQILAKELGLHNILKKGVV